MKRILLLLIPVVLFVSSCDKDDPTETSVVGFSDSSLEYNSYAGDVITLSIAAFDPQKHKLTLNGSDLSYSVISSGSDSTKLSFAVPAKAGSGYLQVSDGTTTVQGPKINYLKQYMFFYLSGYAFGYGMTGYTDNKVVTWDRLSSLLYTIHIKNISVEAGGPVNCVFGTKSYSVSIPSNATFRYDLLGGIGTGSTGDVYFYQALNNSGTSQSHIYKTDFVTATDYPNGVATGSYTWITDLKLDSKNNLYTVEYQLPSVRKANASGVTSFAGSTTVGHADGSGSAAQFTSITGLAFDKSDNLYVSDANSIRMISPNGEVSTIAGTASAGDVIGSAADARFSRVTGLTVGSDGTIYTLDNDNGKVKSISADHKTVSTLKIVGNPGIASDEADFNTPMYVDANGNIYYMVKSAPTKSISLLVLVNEDNVTADVLEAMIDEPGFINPTTESEN